MSTTARQVNGGYSLTGNKTFITNAPVADLFVVFARMAERSGFGSISAFLDEEQARYAEQLEVYARLFRAFDPRPVRLALYFPLFGGWREWS